MPFTFCILLFIATGLINYLFLDGGLAAAIKPAHNIYAITALVLPRLLCKKFTPQGMLFAQTGTLIFFNLCFRGYFGDDLADPL
jgi:hypothetical protein